MRGDAGVVGVMAKPVVTDVGVGGAKPVHHLVEGGKENNAEGVRQWDKERPTMMIRH